MRSKPALSQCAFCYAMITPCYLMISFVFVTFCGQLLLSLFRFPLGDLAVYAVPERVGERSGHVLALSLDLVGHLVQALKQQIKIESSSDRSQR